MVASYCWANTACVVDIAISSNPFIQSSSAHIAQVVEHFLGKEEVTGSSPVMSSTDDDQDALSLAYAETGGALGRNLLAEIKHNQLPQTTSMRRKTHG